MCAQWRKRRTASSSARDLLALRDPLLLLALELEPARDRVGGVGAGPDADLAAVELGDVCRRTRRAGGGRGRPSAPRRRTRRSGARARRGETCRGAPRARRAAAARAAARGRRRARRACAGRRSARAWAARARRRRARARSGAPAPRSPRARRRAPTTARAAAPGWRARAPACACRRRAPGRRGGARPARARARARVSSGRASSTVASAARLVALDDLRQRGQHEAAAAGDRAGVRVLLAGEDAQQRRLAAAVGPEHADAGARGELQVERRTRTSRPPNDFATPRADSSGTDATSPPPRNACRPASTAFAAASRSSQPWTSTSLPSGCLYIE